MSAPDGYLPDSETCDPAEAPVGFFAVPKSTLLQGRGNLCRQCDWRPACQDPVTDMLAYGHRCMSTAVVARRDGKVYRRNDRCTVAFKRLPLS